MNFPAAHPRIQQLLATIETVTGYAVELAPRAEALHERNAWNVVTDGGVQYGVLRVRSTDVLPDAHRLLFAQLADVIAHEADLRREQLALEQRFRLLDRQNSDLTAINRSLSDAAYRDPLTGLYRRWYLTEQLRLELSRAKRYARPLSIVMVDIDGFTRINEQVGPAAADSLLAGVAQRVVSGLRSCDVVARAGSDEFCALLIDASVEGAADVAARLRQRVAAEPLMIAERPISITVSVSTASTDGAGTLDETPERLIERASQSLNRSRRETRGSGGFAAV